MKKGISFTIILLALAYSQSYDSLAEIISNELSSPYVIEVEGEISIWYSNEEGGWYKSSELLKMGQVILGEVLFINNNANRNARILVSCPDNNIEDFPIEIPSHSRRRLLGGQIINACKSLESNPYATKGYNDNISLDYIYTISNDYRLSYRAKTYANALVWARAGEYELALNVLEDYQKAHDKEERFRTLITTLNRASNLPSY